MKLKNKLTLWSCGTVLLIIIVPLVSWGIIHRLLKTTEHVVHTFQMMQHALILEKQMDEIETNIKNYSIIQNKQFLQSYQTHKKLLKKEIKLLENAIWTPSQKNIIINISGKLEKWLSEKDKLIKPVSDYSENNSAPTYKVLWLVSDDEYLNEIKDELRVFYDNEQTLMQIRKTTEQAVVHNTYLVIIYATVIIIVIFFVISYLIASGIRKPVYYTISMMEDIAKGKADLSKRILLRSKDEIGEFIQWFNVFLDNLCVLVKELKNESGTLNSYAESLSSSSIHLANNSVSNSSAIDHMSSAMEDFRQFTEVYYKKTANVLESSEKTFSELITTTKTDKNVKSVDDIRERLDSISGLLDDMNSHSLIIEEFIGNIRELSVQSRILSVNASVIASKAGEHGKGFSVVAGEIKNLSINSENSIAGAMKTYKAIRNLSQQCTLIIENIRNRLIDFVQNAGTVNSEFLKKAELLVDITSTINQLSESRERQIEGIRILASAMESIKNTSSENANSARELETASAKLSDLSSKLKEQTENFKT